MVRRPPPTPALIRRDGTTSRSRCTMPARDVVATAAAASMAAGTTEEKNRMSDTSANSVGIRIDDRSPKSGRIINTAGPV